MNHDSRRYFVKGISLMLLSVSCLTIVYWPSFFQARKESVSNSGEHSSQLDCAKGKSVNHVSVVVRCDKFEIQKEVRWNEGLNVLDATKTIAKSISYSGSGKTAFVNEINGIENEGSTTARNWLYWVNGELGGCGCGVYLLDSNDEIEWHYTELTDDIRRQWKN